MAMVTGVLPAPPATTLPTTMTQAGTRRVLKSPAAYAQRRSTTNVA